MKARVKATGSIIEVVPYSGFDDYDYYEPETKLPWYKSELEFDLTNYGSDPDYWTRLEHQAAIAAMQGMLSDDVMMRNLFDCRRETIFKILTNHAIEYAHALVEKLKEEE